MFAASLPVLLTGFALAVPQPPPAIVLQPWSWETATITASSDVLQALAAVPFQGIPRALLEDAKGIAIIPDVIKAGLVIGGRHGHGVVLSRNPDGTWSNPVFVQLTGGSVGWQIGVQSTDVVLVFKTRNSLDRILHGKSKVTLGGDVAIAAGPVGRQAEAGTDGRLKAEIFSYSRSRGLFAGLSLEGAAIWADNTANERFYHIAGGQTASVQVLPAIPQPAASLKMVVTGLTTPPPPPGHPPVQLVPVPVPPPPPGLPNSPVPLLPPNRGSV
jgi:lipid-binding SYLF domain-containing protein